MWLQEREEKIETNRGKKQSKRRKKERRVALSCYCCMYRQKRKRWIDFGLLSSKKRGITTNKRLERN